jgi:TonB-linked SusC/RagA family outer membrane protein
MKQLHCLLVFFLLTGVIAIAQKKTITGKVTNQATGEVLQGVNILADKQKGGTTTKPDGTYSITVDKNTATLIFSYVGFTPQTIIIADKTTIDVLLVAVPTDMNEVVVIGYGTTKKSHLTGAISKFKNDKLDESPVPRLDQALQGKIAGVQVQNQTSEAGADPKIRVRGLSSVNAGASPLVVVDGHPVPDGLSYVNPADVESVEVLKDAASAAIYGSRGASGVIIITTKSGKADKPKYNVKFSNGSKTVYERYPMMTTTEYTNMLYYEAALKSKDPSITPPTGTQIIANNEKAAYIVENYIVGGPTDWQDQALRSATVRNLQLNVSGGNRNLKYFISGAYQRDQGMMYHSEYDRYMLRTRLDAQLSKRVKFSFNLNPSYNKRERPSVGYIDFVRFQSFLPVYHTAATIAFVTQNPAWANLRVGDFVQARHFNARPYSGLMPDGSLYNSGATLLDPFNTANNTPKSVMETRFINSNEYRLQSSGDLTVNILPGLDFKALGSIYINYGKTVDFARRSSNRDGDANRGQYNDRTLIDLLSENTLTYAKTYKKHSLNVLGGFTAQKSRVTDEQIIGLNFPSDNIQTANNAGTIEQPSIDANGNLQGSYTLKNHEGLVSWLGRVMYSYDNKYLFSASLRTDGSSKFAPGKKWGAFPSVSVGWALSEEKFLDNASGWLDNLKLRASYGVSGNNRILDFAWLDLLYLANYPLGGANVVVQGLGPSTTILANPDITWERTFQYNGGLDMAMFKNAVTFSIDIYQSKTDQLLLKQSAMGFTGVPQTWNNIGNLQNRGIEFEITSNNIRRKNFKWTTSANISHNKNKLLEYGEEKFVLNQGERTELYLNEVGSPFIQFYGYKTDGVWLSQAQITAAQGAGLTSSLSNVFVPGGLKLVDLNGDNKLDAADRTVIGNPYPDFIWGITNTVTYKAFDLSFMFQGSQGGELINGDPNYNETKRYNRNYNTNRWLSPMFPGDGKTPYSTIGFNWMLTDYVVEDASYYCLREVIVGYTLPDKIAKTLHLNSLRAYFSGQNLYFHTPKSYRGINTEARFTSGPYNTPAVDGYQRGGFPMPRTIIFGLDINF